MNCLSDLDIGIAFGEKPTPVRSVQWLIAASGLKERGVRHSLDLEGESENVGDLEEVSIFISI